jgi:hypothetical protein
VSGDLVPLEGIPIAIQAGRVEVRGEMYDRYYSEQAFAPPLPRVVGFPTWLEVAGDEATEQRPDRMH